MSEEPQTSSFRTNLVDCLSKQLSELELFQSMYPNPNEVKLTHANIINDIHSFINNSDTVYTPLNLDFILNVNINNINLEICINLPSLYPNDAPNVHIRCNELNRQQETLLNNNLINYIKEIPLGEPCLYTIVTWLQDQASALEVNSKCDTVDNKIIPESSNEKFSRYWIYSHHIYNKKKRAEIIGNAKDLNLNGFCLPGKPGIICIEGEDNCCKQWWRIIKSMTWQKIAIRQIELYDINEKVNKQKFNEFKEINFQNSNSRNSKHMDMGSFSKYMELLGLSETFNQFFGLCNEDT